MSRINLLLSCFKNVNSSKIFYVLNCSTDSMTYVWGVAFGKDIGAEKTPHSSSARCVSTFYAFFALIVVNTYCANLMAFLVQEHFELPISGIRDDKVIHALLVINSYHTKQFHLQRLNCKADTT